jgi:DNA sulfur modification protein DndC
MRPPVLLDLSPTRTVPFAGQTMGQWLTGILEEIRDLYRADQVPWVVGYSGGKDSTLCLMLVWMALAGLPPAERTKVVHVINTDTGVENPVVAAWVNASLDSMRRAAAEQGLPIEAHRLTPAVEDSFWVCLIGRGYAAPRPKFRWCTERLKIKPSNAFIRAVVAAFGEVILVLGTRKAESRARARTMTRHERRRVRDRLSPNGSLPNSLVYSPIEDLRPRHRRSVALRRRRRWPRTCVPPDWCRPTHRRMARRPEPHGVCRAAPAPGRPAGGAQAPLAASLSLDPAETFAL